MDRRNFIKSASGMALTAAAVMTGLPMDAAAPSNSPRGGETARKSNQAPSPQERDGERLHGERPHHRSLGGMNVSAVGLGCLPMVGYYGGKYEKDDMIALIRHAYDRGITFFDTAEVYGPHTSEEWVGEALQGIRNNVKIATKFGFGVEEGKPTSLNSQPDHLRRAVEGSLKRLRTDHIDLLYQHRVDPATPIEEVAETVKQLMQEGKVLHWGLSEASAKTISRAHKVCTVSAVQSEYSLIWREPEVKIFSTLEELGIGFVPYCPLGRAFLTGVINEDSRFPKNDRRHNLPMFTPEALRYNKPMVALVERWAERKNVSPAQFALIWMLSQKPWIAPIPGTTSMAHLDDITANMNVRLTPEELDEFEQDYSHIDLMGHRADPFTESQIDK